MPLTAVVSKFLDEQEWEDKISIDHVTCCSSLDTFLRGDGQRYQLCIRANKIRLPCAITIDLTGD